MLDPATSSRDQRHRHRRPDGSRRRTVWTIRRPLNSPTPGGTARFRDTEESLLANHGPWAPHVRPPVGCPKGKIGGQTYTVKNLILPLSLAPQRQRWGPRMGPFLCLAEGNGIPNVGRLQAANAHGRGLVVPAAVRQLRVVDARGTSGERRPSGCWVSWARAAASKRPSQPGG